MGQHPLGSLGGGIFTSNPTMTHRGAMAFFLRCSEVWRLRKAILAMRWEDAGCGQPLGVIARHGGEPACEGSPHTAGGGAESRPRDRGARGPVTENPWIFASGGHEGYSFRISGFILSGCVLGWTLKTRFVQMSFPKTDSCHFLDGWNIQLPIQDPPAPSPLHLHTASLPVGMATKMSEMMVLVRTWVPKCAPWDA